MNTSVCIVNLFYVGLLVGDASFCCNGVHGGWTVDRRGDRDCDEGGPDSYGVQRGGEGDPLSSLEKYSSQGYKGKIIIAEAA